MNLGSFEVMLGVNTAGLSRAAVNMRRFESQVIGSNAAMNASFKSLGSQMMLTGTMLTQFVTVPMSLLGGAAVTSFAKFEQVLGKMAALTNFTGSQIHDMSNELLNLAGKVGKAPKELAEGLYFIGSSGIRETALAMDILKKSADAARIGLGDTKAVADAVTSVLNAYGHTAITAGQATDILVAAVREGKGEADALGRVIGKVMPLAVQLGVEFDEVAGSLATLTLSGKSAAEASTQMARLFTTLVQQPPRAEAALEKVGISFAHLRKVLRDDGMLAFVEALKKMVGGNTLDVLQNTKAYEDNITVLGDVFTNIRALLPVLDMMGPNFSNLVKVLDATKNSAGSLADGIQSITGTVMDRWNRSVSSMQASLVKIGEAIREPLIGLIQSVARFIERLANSFSNLTSSQQKTIILWAGILAALGPVLLILGLLQGAVTALIGALTFLTGVVLRLWAAFSAHPLMFLLQAILFASAAFMLFTSSAKKASATQQILSDVMEQANKNIIQEKVALTNLLRLANSENASKQARESAIRQINSISPEYLGFIDSETLKTVAATTAINTYVESLRNKAKLEAIQQKQVSVEKDYLSSTMSGDDRKINKVKGVLLQVVGALSFVRTGVELVEQAEDKQAEKSRKNYVLQTAYLNKMYDETQKVVEGGKDQIKVIDEITVAIDKATGKPIVVGATDSGKEVKTLAEQISALTTLMDTASGKRLKQLSREWFALDKIQKKQDELINQAKAQFDNAPIKPLGVSVETFYPTKKKVEDSPAMKQIKETSPQFFDLSNLDKRIAKGNLFAKTIAESEELNAVFSNTNKALQDNADIANILGDGYNKAAQDVSILQGALDTLTSKEKMDLMSPEQIDLVQQMIKKFNELNETVNQSTQLLSAWKSLFSSLGSLANTVAKYMGDSFQELFGIFQEGAQIISGVLRVIEAITKVTKLSAAAEKAKNIATASGIPITLAAAGAETTKAAASTSAAVAGAASSVAWIPIVGIGLALAGIAAIAIALSSNSSKKSKATGMATGGMVPSGFPNDSFPAMLTSGETVIPLNKVSEIFGKDSGNNKQEVRFVIEGRELVGILNEMGKFQKSF